MKTRRDHSRYVLAAALIVLPWSFFVAPASQAQHYVAAADTAFPRVQYPDSLTSLNDRCIVRQVRLGLHTRPVYVNGYPIGFC